MNKEERLKIILNNDYDKLLAYLAGGLISFFTLLQMFFKMGKISELPYFMTFLTSLSLFGGIIVLTYASFRNFEEIVTLENDLKLNKFGSSKIFSKQENGKKVVSPILKIIVWAFIVFSFLIFLYINELLIFFIQFVNL